MWNVDVAGGAESVLVRAHTGRITGIVAPPPHTTLVTSADDGSMRVWAAGTWELLKEIHTGAACVSCLALVGTLVVSGESLAPVHAADAGVSVVACAESDVVKKAAGAVPDCAAAVCVWDVKDSWPLTHRLEGAHRRHVFGVAGVCDRWLVSCGDDWKLRVWDRHNAFALYNEIDGREGSFLSLLPLFGPFDAPLLATGGANGKVQVWDVSADWPLVCVLGREEAGEGSVGSVVALSLIHTRAGVYLFTGEDSREGAIVAWQHGACRV